MRSVHLLVIASILAASLVNAGSLWIWGDFICQNDFECNEDSYKPKSFNSGSLAGKSIVHIATGNLNSIVVDSNNNIHTWSWVGDRANEEVPKIATSAAISGKTIAKVAAGDGRVMALSADGQAYLWNLRDSNSVPTEIYTAGVLSGKKITDISSGRDHNLVLADDEKAYSWGKNDLGQLGDGKATSYNLPSADSTVPVAVSTAGVLQGVQLKSIVAASRHSLALRKDGKAVFTWGSTEYGQNGNGVSGFVGEESDRHAKFSAVPVQVGGAIASQTIVQIAAGTGFDLALSSNGKVYGWGANFDGTLAQSDFFNVASSVGFRSDGVLSNKIITKIAGGDTHTLLLDSAGNLYTVGRNQRGALGIDSVDNTYKTNQPVAVHTQAPLSQNAELTAAGGWHNLVTSQAVTVGPTTTKPPTTTTSPTAVSFGNYRYQLIATPKNPLSADAHCQILGGRLASITGANLNEFLKVSFAGKSQEYWIGLRRVNSSFKWIDNIQPVTYTNWDTNQPGSDTYTLFINNAASGTVGKWKTQSGTVQKPFLCKIRNN